MNKNLKAWYECRKQMEADILNATTEKKILHEHHMWEWSFPQSMVKNTFSKAERAAKERVAYALEDMLAEAKPNQ